MTRKQFQNTIKNVLIQRMEHVIEYAFLCSYMTNEAYLI